MQRIARDVRPFVALAAAWAAVGCDTGGVAPIYQYDYRQVVAARDLSGIGQGPVEAVVDVAVPKGSVWTEQDLANVQSSVRGFDLSDDGAPLSFSIAAEQLPGRTDARRMRLTASSPPGHVVLFQLGGRTLEPAFRDSGYLFDSPETLVRRQELSALEWPGFLLRTSGTCNHLVEVAIDASGSGDVAMEFQTSEDVAWNAGDSFRLECGPGSVSGDFVASISPVDFSAQVEPSSTAPRRFQLRLPREGVVGDGRACRLTAQTHQPFAGAFRQSLSCTAAELSFGFGIGPSAASLGRMLRVLSPLGRAYELVRSQEM